MKSAHRHELGTNVLAHRLETYIERFRPHVTTVAGVLIGIILLLLIWSYVVGSSSARRDGAWDEYNQAVSTMPPNLDQLHRAAEQNPNSKMQQLADVTWADGLVWMASRNYINNRTAAMDSLSKATSAYQGVIQSSDNEQLIGRSRLGLARVYEMQNEIDKARDQYKQVTGAYAQYAQVQAERLAKPDVKETYAWLATAQPPRPRSPMGPGTPGQRPEFSPGDIGLPNTPGPAAGQPENPNGGTDAFDDLLKKMKEEGKVPETPERYGTGQPPATESAPATPGEGAPANESKDAPAPPSAPPATPPTTEATKGVPETGTPPGDNAKK